MSAKTKSTTVNAKSDYVLAAIAFCVVGVLFCYSQSSITITLSMLAIGTVLTVLGLLELINKNFIVGAIEAAIGIVLIVLACVQPNASLILLGVAAILFGLFVLFVNIKSIKGVYGVFVILICLFALTVGALFIAAYFESTAEIFIALGAISIAVGVVLIVRRLFYAIKHKD